MRTVKNVTDGALTAFLCAASLWSGPSPAQTTPDAAAKEAARNIAVGNVCLLSRARRTKHQRGGATSGRPAARLHRGPTQSVPDPEPG